MKLIYATDLHGNSRKYRKILEIAQTTKADAVINGGDMLPKDVDLHKQDVFIEKFLDAHFAEYKDADIDYLCMLGNDDLKIFDKLFSDICGQYENITNLADMSMMMGADDDAYTFVGMNWVTDYPFRLKDRCRKDKKNFLFERQYGTGLLSKEDGFTEIDDWFKYADTLPTIAEELEKLEKPSSTQKIIYVIHDPPARIKLDVIGDGRQVGSNAVHEFIQLYQPTLTLHGHIHENYRVTKKWKNYIGQTICVQPGQERSLIYVEIDTMNLKEMKRIEIIDYQRR